MRKIKKEHKIFVISAPSGAGKTTLAAKILKSCRGIKRPISYTTRKPRKSEKQGRDYSFITRADFRKKIKHGFFAEWAKVFADYYGTGMEFLDREIKKNDIMLVIDTQGAFNIKKKYPSEAILIFIMPPSITELKKRLAGRKTEKPTIIEKRFKESKREIRESKKYDHRIINDNLGRAVRELKKIILLYKH